MRSPRVLLWVLVLIVAAVVLVRYRQSRLPKPAASLAPAAVTVAGEYARDVVSAHRCADAKGLGHGSLGDPCKTFAGLHGDRVGSGRIVRDCSSVAGRLGSQKDRLDGAPCVQLPVRGGGKRGALSVWLAENGSGWQVVAAASVVHG